MSNKVYEIITDRIIRKLKEGVVPWHKPWKDRQAVNWVNQKPYRGVNTHLLAGGEYATFNQIRKAGGQINKGEESHIIVFWRMIESAKGNKGKNDHNNDEVKTIPALRYYRVFEVNTQVTGIERKRQDDEAYTHNPIQNADKIIEDYINPPKYINVSGRVSYNSQSDLISTPPLKDFKKREEYYSVLFHEIVHSTGNKNRLNRAGIINPGVRFRSPEN